MKEIKNPNSRFTFNIPVELKKSKDKAGKEVMKLGGIASTPDEDADGEFLDPNGFDIKPFLKSGFVNYNHLASKDPSTIIGEPTSKTKVLKDKGLYIEAELYKDSELARKTYKLAKVLSKNGSGRKLQWSIEGKAIERDPLNEKRVLKAKITGVALTLSPKNSNTFADIVKGNFEFEEEIEAKSLKAEIYDQKKLIKSLESELEKVKSSKDKKEDEEEVKKTLTTSSPSGRAIQPESLDKKTKKLTKSNIISKINSVFPDIVLEKAELIYGILINDKMKKGKNDKKLPSKEEIKKAEKFLNIQDGAKKSKKKKSSKKPDGLEKGEKSKNPKEDEMSLDKGGKYMKKGGKKKSKMDKGGDMGTSKKKSKKMMKEDENEYVYMKKAGCENEYTRYKNKGGELEKAGDGTWVKDDAGKYNPKEANGGQQTKMSEGNLVKSVEEAMKPIMEHQKESNKSIGLIFKGMRKENQENFGALAERIEALEKGTGGRKSITNAQALEKGFGGNEPDALIKAKGEQLANQLSVSRDKVAVANLIEKSMYADLEKGETNSIFEKALTTFELNGTVNDQVVKAIKINQGIELIK